MKYKYMKYIFSMNMLLVIIVIAEKGLLDSI